MAKIEERRTAKELYIKGLTQKEIASIVKVQEKTISDWVKKFGWKEERDARFNSTKNQITHTKKLISELTQRRMDIIREMDKATENNDLEEKERLQKESARISAEVANYNKTLQNLDKENRVTLSIYIDVMQSIFNALQKHDVKLYMKCLTFQEEHLTEISLKLG